MYQARAVRTLSHDPEAIWEALAAFNAIEEWHPNIVSSPGTGREDFGVGARRVCTFKDGNGVTETVTKLDPGRSMTLELSEFKMPLHSAGVTFDIKPADRGADVTMVMEFEPKFGPLGAVMATLMMKPMMGKVMGGLLDALQQQLDTQTQAA